MRLNLRPERSRAAIVFSNEAGSRLPAMAAISARCAAKARSKAGGKCSGLTAAKEGKPSGPLHSSSSGFGKSRSTMELSHGQVCHLVYFAVSTVRHSAGRSLSVKADLGFAGARLGEGRRTPAGNQRGESRRAEEDRNAAAYFRSCDLPLIDCSMAAIIYVVAARFPFPARKARCREFAINLT